ncbi:LysM peptidoglycan-binding domain-containing protein [Buchnera aphidicola (Hyadaphis tataricae)]|uniref:LysM peptidoglycan-binding domain-containing protein n=1 Tax=Buchnera aphidicola (Hyadaphis tataricae) TaxID=1241859 RepID=A0A4D6XZH5_9GAMM|nr:peptidoglycan DD-metalloendopeptidase family protein [Buchnera aphidicola]QCI21707.1 LysM peptidoglycan-binding domain-containing protein [Buchnera aphidicola (Hyadaphis tataricae)]
MPVKKNIFKLILAILIYTLFYSFAFAYSVKKNNIKKFIFLKKNECFTNFNFNVVFFKKKEQFVMKNNRFFGILFQNRFKMFYVVKKKETLYSISKISGHNYHKLSEFNHIKYPYQIYVGQKIWIGDIFIDNNQNICLVNTVSKSNNLSSCRTLFKNIADFINFLKKDFSNNIKKEKLCFLNNPKKQKTNPLFKNNRFRFSNIWFWPVKIKNVQHFYNRKSKNIFSFTQEPIFAVSSGEVVCITDVFEKYGKLIIIRHNNHYLSIYGCNGFVLVKEKDKVFAQQQISTMSLCKNHLFHIYFELRYKGEPINPLNILPK